MFLTSGSNYNLSPFGVVPREYVDSIAGGIIPLPSCVVCKNDSPFSPFPSGYNYIIDDVSLNSTFDGSAVLINAQGGVGVPDINNGIYIISAGQWSRSLYLTTGDVATSTVTAIKSGATYANYKFVCTTGSTQQPPNYNPAIIDVSAVLWSEYEVNEELGQGLERVIIDNFNVVQVTDNVYNGIIPIGGIIMWSGNNVPTNWILCDGSNNTPDLRDRFIVGSGSSYSIGATGGSATVKLTTGEIPAHSHPVNDPGHSHTYKVEQQTSGCAEGNSERCTANQQTLSTQYQTGETPTGITIGQNTGGGAAHENRPPYYALAFIMRIS